MIELNNINIVFSKEVINGGSIAIQDGKITAITGESGSGKTSVLYLLGLISSNKQYQYKYNGQLLDIHDSQYLAKLRREEFGFLFQDSSLIDNITIEDNIRVSANLSGNEISQEEIRKLLAYVDLESNILSAYPKQLSGGELQRAAIASIIAKKPEYIFADEPTSALDEANTQKIIDILKKLSSEGITVVIATHSKALCDAADIVYNINECTISLKRASCSMYADNNEFNKNIEQKNYKFGFKDLLNYVLRSQKKGRIIKFITTVFCGVAIAGFSLTNSVLTTLSQTQQELINQISDREIFLVNQLSVEEDIRDYDGNPVITEDIYNRICQIEGVDEVYPFF